jgi:succinoglycan biosynthesis transport protein ExoP
MVKRQNSLRGYETEEIERDNTISFDELLGVVRRQGLLVGGVGLLAGIFGLAFALTTTPQYTATAKIIIDSPSMMLDQMNPFGDMGTDNATILSEVEVLRSEKVIGAVVDRLNLSTPLSDSTVSQNIVWRFLSWISRAFSLEAGKDRSIATLEEDALAGRKLAIQRTIKGLEIKRLGLTYILSIQYTSPSPGLAAQVANTFASVYIDEQVALRFASANQAREWLKERIDELTKEAQAADLQVQQFRAESKLVTVDGRRMDEQQLGELNSQLVVAISAASQAESKYQRIESIIASGDVRSLVTEALGSAIIIDLRQKYLTVSKQALELEVVVGKKHSRVIALNEEMRRYEQQIFEELQRIRESTKSELAIARQTQADLELQVKGMSAVSAENNEVLVELRALEDRATTARAMLQTLLQRDQEAQQGQSFAMSEARIISAATAPTRPSYPNKLKFTLAAMLLGLVGGAGIGYLREIADRSFRHGRQIEALLDLPLICAVPLITEDKASSRRGKSNLGSVKSAPQAKAKPELPSDRLVDYAVTAPMSGFAEALRSIKLSSDMQAPSAGARVIGFVSSFPGEGKSTISKNFASLLALSGFRTILIDADLRAHGLTRYVDRDNQHGLVEVLNGEHPLEDVLRKEIASGLEILLSVVNQDFFNSAELLSSGPMNNLLASLRRNYDYVILDLPPMGPVVDALAVAPQIDSAILIVEWGKTPRQSVKTLLNSQQTLFHKCAGVVLNKVDAETIHRYDYDGSNYYGYGKYNYDKGYRNYYVEKEGHNKAHTDKRSLAAWLDGRGVSLSRNRGTTASGSGQMDIRRRGNRVTPTNDRIAEPTDD